MFPELPLPELRIQLDELELGEWYCTLSSLELTVQVEQEATRINGDVPYILTAQANDADVISAPRSGGGCTFVFVPAWREVKDLRLYVEPAYRGRGYGSLVVQFVKAYFFAHYFGGRLRLPAGGILVPMPRRITVLPSKVALGFYKRHGFEKRVNENKMFYISPQFSI